MAITLTHLPDWVAAVATTSGPLGFLVALLSLAVSAANAFRQARAEQRGLDAKIGTKFVGVRRDVDIPGEQYQIFQLRLVASEPYVVTDAGISFRSKLRLGLWVDKRQNNAGFVYEGDREIHKYLPQVVTVGETERLAIPAESPSREFWTNHYKKRRSVRCWIELGNCWIIRTESVVIQNLTRSYDAGHF